MNFATQSVMKDLGIDDLSETEREISKTGSIEAFPGPILEEFATPAPAKSAVNSHFTLSELNHEMTFAAVAVCLAAEITASRIKGAAAAAALNTTRHVTQNEAKTLLKS